MKKRATNTQQHCTVLQCLECHAVLENSPRSTANILEAHVLFMHSSTCSYAGRTGYSLRISIREMLGGLCVKGHLLNLEKPSLLESCWFCCPGSGMQEGMVCRVGIVGEFHMVAVRNQFLLKIRMERFLRL